MNNTFNTYWASLVIEELYRNGINYFVISPGSRSTPLVSAIAAHPNIKYLVAYDERGGAFNALGYAKATGKPAALISTSGTAPANYLPAIIEGYQEKIPMIILSADRPIELQDCGANQTINQNKLFGNFTQWDFNFSSPSTQVPPEFVLTTIDQGCVKSRKGPVHFNFSFREPLVAITENISFEYKQNILVWENQTTSFTQYNEPKIDISKETINNIVNKINKSQKCLISIGTLYSDNERDAVFKLVKNLKCAIYADITSGLRLTNCGTNIIKHFDQELLSEDFNNYIAPDLLLHIGGKITSKRFSQFFNTKRPKDYIVVNPHNDRLDNIHSVTQQIQSDIPLFCKQLSPNVIEKKEKYANVFKDLAIKSQNIIEKYCSKEGNLNEVFISRYISTIIDKTQALFLSNSMPIRDMELYAVEKNSLVVVGSNRGVSGIDGIISSAAGFAKGIQKTTTLLIGDIAFIHDINALSSLSKVDLPLIIVLINNKGGGIFNFLPIAKDKELCKDFFIMPHNYNFCGVCKTFEIDYYKVETKQDFITTYANAIKKNRLSVIECVTNQEIDFKLRKNIKYKIIKSILNS